jgi:hypothetical protein
MLFNCPLSPKASQLCIARGITMSRLPLRGLVRLTHSGLEKAALACAAFGLMHATANAAEGASERLAALDDPWTNPAAEPASADDTWQSQPSRGAGQPYEWSTPGAGNLKPDEEAGGANALPPAPANDHDDWTAPADRADSYDPGRDDWSFVAHARLPSRSTRDTTVRIRIPTGPAHRPRQWMLRPVSCPQAREWHILRTPA